MNLTPYINDLRAQLTVAAEAGGEDAIALAERLSAPLEAATRLVLLEALSNAASEITRELAPGSVDLRLRGRDPEFVVTPPPSSPQFEQVREESTERAARTQQTIANDAGDGGTSRTTLRLSEQLKLRVEEAAAQEGLSVNAWLVRAVTLALDNKRRGSGWRESGSGGEHFTGWAR